MTDPYFEKPPRGPLVSTAAVVCLCLTVAFCAFLAFASVQPDAAVKIGGEVGGAVFVLLIVLWIAIFA